MIDLNLNPNQKDLRLFAIILVPFSFLLGWILTHNFEPAIIGWIVNAILCVAGFVGSIWPRSITYLFVAWTVVTFPIGWTISHVVLALIYFGVFFPIGFTMRIFGYDPLQLRESDTESYWITLESISDKERYFRQF